jgi:hypothetical protein
MPATTKPADLIRAEALIARASSESRDYAARVSAPKPADPLVRYDHQVGWLERDIKTLCQEVAYYQAECGKLRAQKAQAYDDLEEAGLMKSEDGGRCWE